MTITLADELRNNAKSAISRLKKLGVKNIIMLTGDTKQKAKMIADELGIDEVRAELLPQDKAKIVKELMNEGKKVAFVGDGINDAPALISAHVGISMSRGADIAKATADISLLKDDIMAVVEAKEYANKTMNLINNNFNATVKYAFSSQPNENLKNTCFIYFNHELLPLGFRNTSNPENDNSINLSNYYILGNNSINKIANIETYQQLNILLKIQFLKNITINIPNELVISIGTNYRNDHDEKISNEITQFFDNQFREENIIRRGDAIFKAFILMPLFYLLFDHKGLDKSITQDVFLKLKDSNNEIFDFIYLCLDEIEENIKKQEVSPRVNYQIRRIKHIREFLEKNKNIFDYCAGAKLKGNWFFEKRNVINGEYKTEKLQKLIRYYISNGGVKLIKCNPDGREIQLESGKHMQTIFNMHEEKSWDQYDVNEKYYLDKIYDEIQKIEKSSIVLPQDKVNQQLSLF